MACSIERSVAHSVRWNPLYNGKEPRVCEMAIQNRLSAPMCGSARGKIGLLIASLFLLTVMVPTPSQSCDFCNCVMGINPFYTTVDRVGLTTLLQRSSTDGGVLHSDQSGSKMNPVSSASPKILHGSGVTDSTGEFYPETEQRLTIELSYRHHFSRRVVVTGLLPFTLSRIESVGTLSVQGLGDATVLGHYIFDNLLSQRTPSTLLVGGGLELPTGNNSLRNDHGHLIDARFQPGSGSVDVVANMLLTVPVGKWILAFDAYGKLNNSNGRDDRIGNSLALTSTASHELYRNNPANVAVIGMGGLREELAGKDYINGQRDLTSGFSALWANLGSQLVAGSLKINATALFPLAQHREQGGANESVRFSAGIAYEFH